jgi:hypothetical protein
MLKNFKIIILILFLNTLKYHQKGGRMNLKLLELFNKVCCYDSMLTTEIVSDNGVFSNCSTSLNIKMKMARLTETERY